MYITSGPVTGSDFYGREGNLYELKNAILNRHNISVYGLPKIGKSSLVLELTERYCSEFISKNICFMFYKLQSPKDEKLFFSDLFDFFNDIIENREPPSRSLQYSIKKLETELRNGIIRDRFFVEIFQGLYETYGILLYLVVDEFDYAPDFFQVNIQTLREIIATKYAKIITISRLSLGRLFPLGTIGSNLPGTVDKHLPLGGFLTTVSFDSQKSEVDMYKDLLEKQLSKPLLDSVWSDITYYTGNVPFFLNLFSNSILECVRNDGPENIISLDNIKKKCWSKYYETIQYWHKAIFRLKLDKDVINVAQACGYYNHMHISDDVFNYGLMNRQTSNFCVPYLSKFILENASKKLHYDDLLPIAGIIKRLAENCDEEISNTFERNPTRYDMLVHLRKDLKAMDLRIEYSIMIQNLETFIDGSVTEEELNAIKQRIGECRKQIEA